MNVLTHYSAKPSHYNRQAEHYDRFNEKNSRIINQTLESILKKYKVKTVLDLTCGTGSQVFWLAKRGYEVIGCDINANMLKINDNTKTREIQYSTIDKDGILASFTTYYEQQGANKPKASKSSQTLQVYTAKQLKEMLHRNGFKVLRQCAIDGSRFAESKTKRLITIAKRQKKHKIT